MSSLIDLPSDDTCLMYLVRHGATPHNQMNPPRLQGAGVNESLSETGREQAGRAAAALAGRPIAEVYCSPMKRAVETAQLIAQPHELGPVQTPTLIEVNVGRWEGRTWDEIQAEDPQAYARFRDNPGEHGYPGGENMIQVIERVTAALDGLMVRHLGQEIIVVAHSVVNRTYLGSLMGMHPRDGYRVPQENCAISLVRYKHGKAKAVSVNAITHLM